MPQSKRHPARRPQQRKPRTNHGNPAQKSRPAPPPATGFRATLERRSAMPLALLHQLPGWLVPVLLAAFLFAGLVIGSPWAAVFLAIVSLFLAWLVALAWPVVSPRGRALRVIVIVAVVGATVLKAMGRL